MRVLVTGGAGFIGSHVAERLAREGHAVFILDDLNDFYPVILKEQNLDAVRQIGLRAFYKADIRDVELIRKIMSEISPNVVIHLAARTGVRFSVEQPFLYEEVNIRGTLGLLEASRLAKVQRFIFASSSSVYGLTNSVPFREDDPAIVPISPYAATKIAGEKLCQVYSHLYNLSVICLRFFTVYGPRQRPDLAIRKFTELIDAGEEITIYGDGASARDYTYVDDIVQGVVACLDYPCSYEVFNLGGSCPVPINTVIETLETALNRKARVRRIPAQPGDVPVTYADIQKAGELLGYAPGTTFQEGVERFIHWYREHRVAISAAPPADVSIAGS
jgi:UDP-glucuronate 4-epimerase